MDVYIEQVGADNMVTIVFYQGYKITISIQYFVWLHLFLNELNSIFNFIQLKFPCFIESKTGARTVVFVFLQKLSM